MNFTKVYPPRQNVNESPTHEADEQKDFKQENTHSLHLWRCLSISDAAIIYKISDSFELDVFAFWV